MLMLMFFEPKLSIWCDMFVCVHVMPIPAGSRQMNLIFLAQQEVKSYHLLYPVMMCH